MHAISEAKVSNVASIEILELTDADLGLVAGSAAIDGLIRAVDAMGGSRIFKSPTRKFDPYVVRIQDHALSRVCRKISIWSVSRSSPTS